MTYRSRGRSIVEMAIAVTFVGFLAGFVTVLCIGNYLRAKSAMERQRERRIARLTGRNKVGSSDSTPGSPRSQFSANSSHNGASERHHLIGGHDIHYRHPNNNSQQQNNIENFSNNSRYITPENTTSNRQRQNSHNEEDLILLKENDDLYEKDSAFMSV